MKSSNFELNQLTRRAFGVVALSAIGAVPLLAKVPPRVLVVVAHPDDEYHFAVTIFRIVHELGGTVDQLVITNGEGGYKYSTIAEVVYGAPLTEESTGRNRLPEIRKQETLAAGRILGIRQHFFLDQKDAGYTLSAADTLAAWDTTSIRRSLEHVLTAHTYDFIFTLLPSEESHGHHKAAAVLALEAATATGLEQRPYVLAAEALSSQSNSPDISRLGLSQTEYNIWRTQAFGFHDALNFQIVANWVIAEHKSQGLFQMDAGRHDVERFWEFKQNNTGDRAEQLFVQLASR
jgi:N-acetylglucosamine malate deacetylase 2